MAAQDLFYLVREHQFTSEEDALRIMRAELSHGNLHAMTDRMIAYDFPPNEKAQIMKIRVKVDRFTLASGVQTTTQTKTLYYCRHSRVFIDKDKVREMMLGALQEGNLDLMTDRVHDYGFGPDLGYTHATRIVKISVIVG